MNLPLLITQLPILPLFVFYLNQTTALEQQPTSPGPTHTSTPASEQTSAMTKTSKFSLSLPPALIHYTSSTYTTKNHDTTRHYPTPSTESSRTSTSQQDASSLETLMHTTNGGTPQQEDPFTMKHLSK